MRDARHELTLNEYRAIVVSSPVMIWRAGVDAKCNYFNETWLAFTGRALEQEMGDGWASGVHPDDLGRCLKIYLRHFARREPFEMEYRLRRHDGAYRYIFDRGVPFEDESGEFAGYIGSCVDVDDRKRMEQALRANDEAQLRLFSRVVETSGDFIGICTPDMRVFFVNEAGRRMVGLASMEDVRRTTVTDYFWPEDLPRMESDAIPTLVREGRWSGEVRFRHFQTGTPISTMWNVFVIKDDAGVPVAWATVSPDLTALKKAEEALREVNSRLTEADRRKDEFLGVLSHELRNPLAPIRTGIYLLDHLPADGAQAVRAKEVVRRQTGHLARLVDDLLDVTRISRGKIELDRRRIDLREAVLRTCEDHRSMFDQGQVALRYDPPIGPVWIEADATRISQVLGNLLQNAVKFTPAHGAVAVEVAVQGGNAEMRVRDTGMGIRAENLVHIFEPFAQIEQSLARTQGGLGLGLALSKGLVELHGGWLRALSDGLGRGSEFRVVLPLAPAPAPVASAETPMARTARGRTVLIIEDNADTCESLSVALGLTGHQVRTAHNGRTGIAAAHELAPDVVLCDIGLPDIDGYEVARRLRADEALRSTRLIALSGYARPEDKARAKEAGFHAHVPKPPELEALTEMLAKGALGEESPAIVSAGPASSH